MRDGLHTRLFVVPTLLIMLIPGVLMGAQVVGATTNLGGMNLVGYCQAHGYAGGAQLTGSGIWGWSCVVVPGLTQSFNSMGQFSSVCVWQYGRPDAYATYADVNNAYGLRCAAPDTIEVSDNPLVQQAVSKMFGPYINAAFNWLNLTPSEQQWAYDSAKGLYECQRNLNEDIVSPGDAWSCLQTFVGTFSPIWNPPSAS